MFQESDWLKRESMEKINQYGQFGRGLQAKYPKTAKRVDLSMISIDGRYTFNLGDR